MVFLTWIALILVALAFLLVLLAFWRHSIYEQYSGGRTVTCPENHESAVVNIDAQHAAATIMDGTPKLRLCDCTRWPERAHCGQECLAHAAQAEPYDEVKPAAGSRQIYHLPVLLAAFAAWYVGAIWHSQYLFRARWTEAVGLTQAQVKQIVWWLSPHLLTAAVCLLFAYGVAWLLAVSHRKGVLQGVLMAVLLCAAVIAASAYPIARLPHELFAVEMGYVALATLIMGSIVGGLHGKLVLRSQ